jgi:hypothetical protein
MFHYLRYVLRSFAYGRGRDSLWGRGNMCEPVGYGLLQMGDENNDPLLFYTESCPEGTYLTGVMSEREIMAKDMTNEPEGDPLSGGYQSQIAYH